MKKSGLFVVALACAAMLFTSCRIDYMASYVPGEQGSFEKITDESVERLARPATNADNGLLLWRLNPRFDVSKANNSIAYLAITNGNTNIFVKALNSLGTTTQRTNRSDVEDICYSPNGEHFCFSEPNADGTSYIYITNAKQGTVVQQVSPRNASDYQPRYTPDGKQIFFTRGAGDGASVWSYDVATGNFKMHCPGSNPCPIGNDSFLYTKKSEYGMSEIWLHNYVKGTDSRIKNDPNRNFTSPSVSPDGKWLLFVSTSKSRKVRMNLDIFFMRADGNGNPTQLTFHGGNDCSPVWSPDGKYIYFLSQRGTKRGEYNIWRMDFQAQETLIEDAPAAIPETTPVDKPKSKLPTKKNR